MKKFVQFFAKPLLPSWRFFDEAGHVPRLYVRTARSTTELGEWQPALKSVKRSWYHLFLNPDGNVSIAQFALLEQMIDELNKIYELSADEQTERVVNSVSYRLIERCVRLNMDLKLTARFQFKITLSSQLENSPGVDVLISQELGA